MKYRSPRWTVYETLCRRCRVSDEEAEQIRQARDSRLGEEKDTMADTHIMMQHVVPRHCIV